MTQALFAAILDRSAACGPESEMIVRLGPVAGAKYGRGGPGNPSVRRES